MMPFISQGYTRRGGGVAIYTNKKLSGALAESKSFVIENILECVTVELTIKNHTNVVVSCIYRTPGSPIDTFCENLERNLSDVKSIKTIFVFGDFNIDLLKHETHNNTKHFLDTMYSLGLYPLIDKPTRITDNSTTLIDNIFTNELRFNLTSGIMYNDISDHLPIFALCEYNISRYNVKEFQFIRKMNEDTMASFSNEPILQTWENVLKTDDVNQAYDSFLHIFMILYYSLFMPYIMYCAEVLGNTYATNIHCLVLLQKRVIRLTCGAKRLDHTNLLFHNVHILKLPDLVKLKTAIIMFKAYRYILPMNVQKLLKIHDSRYSC